MYWQVILHSLSLKNYTQTLISLRKIIILTNVGILYKICKNIIYLLLKALFGNLNMQLKILIH